MSKTIEDRIEFLRKCAKLYETDGSSTLSDDAYDAEKEACQKIKPDDPFFSEVGGIDEEHVYGTKVKHKYIMGSLNKDPNPDEFGKWYGKTYPKGVVAIIQLKVDGSSFCLKYQDGKLQQAVSRGNGVTGLDYTENARYISGVKPIIKVQGYVEIKGEVFKNRSEFIRDWADKGYANPRGFTAGSINQKDPLVTKERGLNFIAYEVRGVDFDTEVNKVKFLAENGFDTLKNYTSKIDCNGRTTEEVVKAIQKYMDRVDRVSLPFDVDGIVFKNNNIADAEEMGTTDEGRRPKANRAVKFPTDKKETLLEGVEWNVGRTGALTPVGLLKPVELAGTTVKRVTLHNIKEMVERLGITKIGARVIIAKQGDIIPKVVQVIRDGDGDKITIPTKCPSCDQDLEWDDTHTTKVCSNFECPSQMDRRIEHYFKTIDVLGIGPGIISELTSHCTYGKYMVNSVSDMYGLKLHKTELEKIFGDKAAQNILDAVDSVKEMPLAKLIEAMGIANIGRMSKDIVANAPTIKDVDVLTVEDIVKIHGFAETKAKNFVAGWKQYRGEIDKILNYISIVEVKLDSTKLSGKKFCFTGSFSSPTRGEMEKLVEDNGGKNSSVSKELTALVWDGTMNGSKIDKAKKLNLPIISQKDFLAMLK